MDTPDQLRYLAENIGWLAHQTEGTEAFDELAQTTYLVESTVRQPPAPLWYAGPCDSCRKDMYARRGATQVECSNCQLAYDVEDRRRWLLSVVEDRLERAVVISRALAGLGPDVSRHRLRMWVSRGIIVPRGFDDRGRPLYRVGDVIEVLERLGRKGLHGTP